MKTAIQVEKEFRQKLQDLIDGYNADIEIDYVDHNSLEEGIMVTIPTIYKDDSGDVSSDFSHFSLGRFLYKT